MGRECIYTYLLLFVYFLLQALSESKRVRSLKFCCVNIEFFAVYLLEKKNTQIMEKLSKQVLKCLLRT